MEISSPVIYEVDYSLKSIDMIREDISKIHNQLIFNYPTVYIINHKEKSGTSVYIGETTDIYRRTIEHIESDSKGREDWAMMKSASDAKMLVVGHEMFNKSLTLDIENRLMLYLSSVDGISTVYNRRSNEQNDYYTSQYLDEIFSKVWRKLGKKHEHLFPIESAIRDSALFKASPFHKLTREQMDAKSIIYHKIVSALTRGLDSQLIFVDGEAGTGKTVLMSSLFYDLFQYSEEQDPIFRSTNNYLLVNHDEQLLIYDQIMKKLGVTKRHKPTVMKPTSFINKFSTDEKADIVLIDEGHLLLTQGKQSYRGNNHLDDILSRAKVVILIFDKNQILTTEQYWEEHKLIDYQEKAIANNNYIELRNQIRINSNEDTIKWIRDIIDNKTINRIPYDDKYDLRILDSPEHLEQLIVDKASGKNKGLSRLLATYDWPYHAAKPDEDDQYWKVKIGDWSKPWNLLGHEPKDIKKKNKGMAWAEQDQTIDQVGSTFTIQGFDLNYAGVIIGPSVIYRDGEIKYNPEASSNKKATRNRTLEDGSKRSFGELFLKNELNVLLTRGVNGLYIYAVDEELRDALLKAQKYRGESSDE